VHIAVYVCRWAVTDGERDGDGAVMVKKTKD
jgi:hypothetical protein